MGQIGLDIDLASAGRNNVVRVTRRMAGLADRGDTGDVLGKEDSDVEGLDGLLRNRFSLGSDRNLGEVLGHDGDKAIVER